MPYDTLNRLAMQKAVWRNAPLTGGLNNRFGPQYLTDAQASILENADLKDPSRPKVRDGYAIIGSAQGSIAADLLAKRINSIGALSPTGSTATKLFITIDDAGSSTGRTYRTTDTTGAWTEATVAGPASYDPGAAEDIPTAQLADCYYILGTTPAAFSTAGEPSGTISTNTDDIAAVAGSPPHNGVDICFGLGRGWIFTTDCDVAYSKFNPAAATINSDWARTGTFSPTTTAGRLEVSPNMSQVARGCLFWNETSLLLFYDNSVEQVVVEATDPFTNSARRIIEPRFGLISRRAKAVLGQEVFFMDQYGSVRSLSQTTNAEQAGVASLPLSEPIAAALPGRLNFAATSAIHFVIKREKLYVYVPLDANTQCKHRLVYNLAYRCWEGVDELAHAHGHATVSDIRGNGANGFEMFVTNGDTGSPLSKVYRTDTGSFTDDGTSIRYVEWGKAITYETPEAEKLFRAMEAGFIGDAGAQIQALAKVGEDGPEIPLTFVDAQGVTQAYFTIPASQESDFPLVPADFPLLPADFPLLDGAGGGIARRLWFLTDLTNETSGRNRMIRFGFKFETTAAGLECQRAEYWATAKILPRQEME